MPVPKRKTSKARRDLRHSTRFIRPQAITGCANCNAPLNPHVACSECGFYKGRKIMKTKLDRSIKRGEVRKVRESKVQTKQAQDADQNSSSESAQ